MGQPCEARIEHQKLRIHYLARNLTNVRKENRILRLRILDLQSRGVEPLGQDAPGLEKRVAKHLVDQALETV